MDLLVYSFPVFVALVLLEFALARAEGRYRLNDAFSNLSCGISDQALNVFTGTFFIAVFDKIQKGAGVFSFEPGAASTWLLLLVGVDLSYYVFHRASHRVAALWATHIVHHQSEEYNFTVSLRQGAVATWVTYAFYLPLALVGFPAKAFLFVHAGYEFWQFTSHTRLVKTLGPLEWALVTPSLHRVHHGRDPEYIDKNYSGLLNVWDRLFGSYQREIREPLYGITTGIKSWSPWWANMHYFAELWRRSRAAATTREALLVWLMPPGWESPGAPYRKAPFARYDANAPARLRPYLRLGVGVSVLGALALFWSGPARLGVALYAVGAGLLVVWMLAVAAALDRRLATQR